MELWIRSQDGERLTTCRDFRIYYAKVDDVWVIEDCDDLAAYKTKERALEVLDEIQDILEQILDPNLTTLKIFVYEMPKE